MYFFPRKYKTATKIRSTSQKVILIFKKKKIKKRTLRNNREMLFKRTIFI